VTVDGVIHRTFDLVWFATDSSGNQAAPARTRVNLKIVDLRNTVEELKKLSQIDSSIHRVEREYQVLERWGMMVLALIAGIVIGVCFIYGRQVVNMLAYLSGAGMSYPAFEEGGSLWLSGSRWWWTENERRQFLLTQWALKRE